MTFKRDKESGYVVKRVVSGGSAYSKKQPLCFMASELRLLWELSRAHIYANRA